MTFGIHIFRLRVQMSWNSALGYKCKAWLDPPDHKDDLQRQHQLLRSHAKSSGADWSGAVPDAKLVGIPLVTFLRMCEDLSHEVEARRRWEAIASHQDELVGAGGTLMALSEAPLNGSRAPGPRPGWRRWYGKRKDGKKRNHLRAALATLSETQLKSLVVGVVAEMERRIPRLAWSAGAAPSAERARSDSTEELLRHKDLDKWVGAGL
ncbi:hypothetical protein LTR01_001026 [Friedmanniomyces endolithicus]|nr:hypothetical protein LTS00_004470 [Friedmanniomyces endolithicus]KAK0315726.1 hypothetical protein LTR01_001026 [Friedmanniomyces endolithicus]KAK0833824.1 hypothetical protein LTR73_001587 [Friedmanniomyces endolithicus]